MLLQYFRRLLINISYLFFALREYWKNEDQNWAKNELFFNSTSSSTNRFVVFYCCFSLKRILPKPKKNHGRIFIPFKYFLDYLFLTVFVQHVISKFVKVLRQSISHQSISLFKFHFPMEWNKQESCFSKRKTQKSGWESWAHA